MDHQLICEWLGLDSRTWPPDHYRLLDLDLGEADPERIEEHVHERLEKVRCYQLIHPEQVTEAMNRLAQAFVCLTDPDAKRAYDRELLGEEAAAVAAPVAVGRRHEEVEDPLAWLFAPWRAQAAAQAMPGAAPAQRDWKTPPPSRRPLAQMEIPVLPTRPAPAQAESAARKEAAKPTPPPPSRVEPLSRPTPPPAPAELPATASVQKLDHVVEAANSSAVARRGLGTKRALFQRIVRTRRLLHAWEQAGRYLGHPKRKLSKPAEAASFIRELAEIRDMLSGFPPMLGAAGQPGYLVVSLARQQIVVPMFQTLLPSQREALARDWQAGQTLLIAHRQFLRQKLRTERKRHPVRRAVRATRAFLNEEPGAILLLLALVAINIAIWRSYVPLDFGRGDHPAPANHGTSNPPDAH
jgi:hypothetical protein